MSGFLKMRYLTIEFDSKNIIVRTRLGQKIGFIELKKAENSKGNYKIAYHNIKKFTTILDGQGNKARLRIF